jgi:hypothetical protein
MAIESLLTIYGLPRLNGMETLQSMSFTINLELCLFGSMYAHAGDPSARSFLHLARRDK